MYENNDWNGRLGSKGDRGGWLECQYIVVLKVNKQKPKMEQFNILIGRSNEGQENTTETREY